MISAQITGSDVGAVLREMKQSMLRKTAVEAAHAGASTLELSARAFARRSVDTGNLMNSIGVRVKKSKRGSSINATIGPRRGFKIKAPDGSERNAAANANLTEFGHMAPDGKQVAAKPFLRPAFAQSGQAAVNAAAGIFKAQVEKEAARLGKKEASKFLRNIRTGK